MSGRLEGKRALITGAASGIGLATALKFVQEGALVAACDIDSAGLAALEDRVGSLDGRVLTLRVDVRDEIAIADAVARCERQWSGLDVVVANAAVQLFGRDNRADQLDLDVWRETIDVNLTGAFLTCKHGARALLRAGGGAIVCVVSPTSLFGLSRSFDAYSASKAGVLGLARVMANDFAADGIRVNAVMPGSTDTPLVRGKTSPERRAARLAAIPLGRQGEATEVANVIAFVASDEASYMTGAVVVVDGGLTAI